MGRCLKRVPLDFDWPLYTVWEGFVNSCDESEVCQACDGTGYSPQAEHLHDQWYGYAPFNPASTGSTPFTPDTPAIRAFAERQVARHPEFYGSGEAAIVREAIRLSLLFNGQWHCHLDQHDVDALWAEGRLSNFNPNWKENYNKGVPPPTAAEVNTWSVSGHGHDGINCMICIREKCKRLGYEEKCHVCKGHAVIWPSEEARSQYENWQKTEPPAGEGWQMWETVSEGSPVSPVFPTSEAFAEWLVKEGYSAEAVEQFINVGWSPSFAMVDKKVYNDLETLTIPTDES